ncbi:hypothetical protein BB559_005431 [Furculomyces boomerangus]|uniref:Uncharacterized protein n=2 Tax=Harpellales TaxID=61421 RepID=A0A2T9Y8S4_9FUNG|nr:hypothetical protein BB559_005431 [Furculomyces boomerangus]PWA01099.1 hypothetical protein BB558_002817 [Smittium angustum]
MSLFVYDNVDLQIDSSSKCSTNISRTDFDNAIYHVTFSTNNNLSNVVVWDYDILSHLFTSNTPLIDPSFFILLIIPNSIFPSNNFNEVPSTTNTIKSASSNARQGAEITCRETTFVINFATTPGVSNNIICSSPTVLTPTTLFLVVCALSETILIGSPTSPFVNVDFPLFALPINTNFPILGDSGCLISANTFEKLFSIPPKTLTLFYSVIFLLTLVQKYVFFVYIQFTFSCNIKSRSQTQIYSIFFTIPPRFIRL